MTSGGTALRGSNPAWCFRVWGEVESKPSERGPEGSEDGGKQHFHGNGSLVGGGETHCGPGGGPIPIGKAQLFMGEEGASSTTP